MYAICPRLQKQQELFEITSPPNGYRQAYATHPVHGLVSGRLMSAALGLALLYSDVDQISAASSVVSTLVNPQFRAHLYIGTFPTL
jgi:ABC-type transporter Mla maintaining outer membrane lipid asymmetry permease subunit MlaE